MPISIVDPKSRSAPRRRVLVVDDNLDAVHSFALLLREMGLEVQFAINGFAALEIARAFRPDVILLDMALPDFNGPQIARQLKWEPGLERTALIAISGHSDDLMRKSALDAGCAEYHVKPLAPNTVETIVARALSLPPRGQKATGQG